MKEDQAKTKWCPLAKSDDAKCIASDCMAWRWNDNSDLDEEHGHCGAFGHPNAQP